MEFRWEWGTGHGEGAHAYVKDAQLRIAGVQLRIYATYHDPPSPSRRRDTVVTEPTSTPRDPDWKARYLQQIVDHLLLNIESVQIVVDLPSNETSVLTKLCVTASDMQLVTLGGSAEQGLRQRLVLGSLAAVVQTCSADATLQQLPLLDPIGYAAIVQRVSGRRFVDGIGNGLIISGERDMEGGGVHPNNIAHATRGLRFHTGVTQVASLLQLQKMFGLDKAPTDNDYSSPAHAPLAENKSSLFVLPTKFMSLVLENGTDISFQDCIVTFRTDGSTCRVDCTNGNLCLDGTSINHTKAGLWRVDLLRYLITVESNPDSQSLATQESTSSSSNDAFYDSQETESAEPALTELEIGVDHCRKIYQGFNSILPLFDENDTNGSVTPWTFQVDGVAAITLISSMGKKAFTKLDRPCLRYIGSNNADSDNVSGLPVVYQWNSVEIKAPELGNLCLFLRRVDSSDDGQSMSFSQASSVSLSSLDDTQTALHFLEEFTSIMEGESIGLPLKVRLSSCAVCFQKEEIKMNVREAVAIGFDVTLASVSGTVKEASFSLEELRCNTSTSTVNIKRISSANLNGVASLVKPVEDLKLQWDAPLDGATFGKLSAEVGTVLIQLPSPSSSVEKQEALPIWNLKPPAELDISIRSAEVRQSGLSNAFLGIDSTRIKVVPSVEQTALGMTWKSLNYQDCWVTEGSATFTLSTTCLDTQIETSAFGWSKYDSTSTKGTARTEQMKMKARLCPISSVASMDPHSRGPIGYPVEALRGCVTAFEVSLGKIVSCCVPEVGILVSPVQNAMVSFSNGQLKTKIGEIHWQDSNTQLSETSSDFAITDCIDVFRFPIEILLGGFRLDSGPANEEQPIFGFKDLRLMTQPADSSSFLVPFSVSSLRDIWYQRLVEIPFLQIHGALSLHQPRTIHRPKLTLSNMTLSADFSSTKWADTILQKTETSKPIPLPHVELSAFDLLLRGKGGVIAVKGSTLNCSRFTGNETSNSQSVTEHYIRIVKKRIPFLLSSADVAGVNVGDSIGMAVARTAMRSSVVGSVAGLGVRDAVGGAITLGKESRGASETHRYHFGDVSRGVVAAARLAAKNPNKASSAAADYTSRNRERLGGAAGSGAAMIAGAAIAGPIGLIAGSFIGNAAGKSAVKATVGEYQGEKSRSQQKQNRQQGQQHSSIASNSQPVDDPFDVFATQSPTISRDIASVQASTAAVADPFAVFETSSSPPPQQGFTPTPDDPFAFLASQQATTSPPLSTSRASQTSRAVAQQPATSPMGHGSAGYPTAQPTSQQYQSPRAHLQRTSAYSQSPAQHPAQPNQPQAPEQQRGYKFGDITRGLVAKGKQKRGGQGTDYKVCLPLNDRVCVALSRHFLTLLPKFGDFTRGLFG